MPISDYHFYHGAALSLIVSEGQFTGLARIEDTAGVAYAVNHDIGLYMKHSTMEESPWQFTFTPEHQQSMRRLYERYRERAFVGLVCGRVGVCLLTYGEYAAIIDENFADQKALTVSRPEGGGFRVRGANGDLGRVVPLTHFPRGIFGA